MPQNTAPLRIISDTEVCVTLKSPIRRGDKDIYNITLREPRASDLKGISQKYLDALETSQIATLIPKISDPKITYNEYMGMRLVDVNLLGAGVTFFTLPEGLKADSIAAMVEMGYLAEPENTATESVLNEPTPSSD